MDKISKVTSPSGHTVYFGRNAHDNHIISSHLIDPRDYWFHANGVSGSHVLMKCDGSFKISKDDKAFCKKIAVKHSKCKSGASGVCQKRGYEVCVRPCDKLGTVVLYNA